MKPQAPQSVDFDALPAPGQAVIFRGQRYELAKVRPHVNRAGDHTTVLVWTSHCARCAYPFETVTAWRAKWLNRRCADCARPGIRA